MRRMSVALHRDRRGLRDDGTRTAAEQAPLAQAPNHCEEQGDEEDPDGRRDQHPEEHAGADRMAARGPGAARREQRCYTQDEGERRHQDRPQPLAPGLEGRFLDGATLGPELLPGAGAPITSAEVNPLKRVRTLGPVWNCVRVSAETGTMC